KIEAAKETIVKQQPNELSKNKDKQLSFSNNRKKSSLKLAKLHAHIVNLRADFTHKLTTRLCRENQAVIIEDLNVAGMLKNEKLARSISDIGFGTIRRQLEYKALRYGVQLIIADRWYASSKLCSKCNFKHESLKLSDRYWICSNCNAFHDRDINAAINLKRLATGTALPVASQSAMNDTEIGIISISGGKVTPVRHECGR
ncbi:MAG: RNA-guided endonuclease InsQ/TnpB family protein, partial [Gammaproteobacteria bacterium]